MTCSNCGSEGVMSELMQGIGTAPGGFVRKCVGCGNILPQHQPEEDDDGPIEPMVLPRAGSNAPRAPAKRQTMAAAPQLTPATVLRLSKQRRRELRREIARDEKALKTKKRELAELDRLLDAAEGKPRAVVRPIRTTA